MAVKKTVVCGIYQDAQHAKETVPALVAAGFAKDAISVSQPDGKATLSVHCDTPEQTTRAEEMLKQTGAHDVSSSDEEVEQVFVES